MFWLGGALIAILAGYALFLHWRLWQLRRRNGVGTGVSGAGSAATTDAAVGGWQPDAGPVAKNARMPLERAIYLLSEAILDNRLTHTEGCLRICAIANGMPDREKFRQEFGVLFRLAEATAHIPILAQWQALEKAEQRAFDRERRQLESRYAEAVVESAQRLRALYRHHLAGN